jgi:hypothetical protein
METAALTRRALVVLLAVGASLFSFGRADAMYSWDLVVERPVDWTLSFGDREFGVAEEVVVKHWFSTKSPHQGREVQSVSTAIHFGFGSVSVPCRFMVFVVCAVTLVIGAVALSMLPSLRRRWGMSRVSER